MKKVLNICLLLTSLVGYMEWGGGNHAFIFKLEFDLIFGSTHHSGSFLHPFVLIPLIGQLMLIWSVVQKIPGKVITFTGLICISLIMLMLLLIGIMTINIRMILSVMPFVITGVLVIWSMRKRSAQR